MVAAAILMHSAVGLAQSSPPVPPPPVSSAPPESANPAAWTQLRISTADRGVTLERRFGSLPREQVQVVLESAYAESESPWRLVCAAPCDGPVELGGEYRIAGAGITASSSFALHGPRTELQVRTGSGTMRRVGVGLAVSGFIAAAVGGVFLGTSALKGNDGHGLTGGQLASLSALIGGGAIGLVGVGLCVGSSTSVRDEQRRDLARVPPGPALHATYQF